MRILLQRDVEEYCINGDLIQANSLNDFVYSYMFVNSLSKRANDNMFDHFYL